MIRWSAFNKEKRDRPEATGGDSTEHLCERQKKISCFVFAEDCCVQSVAADHDVGVPWVGAGVLLELAQPPAVLLQVFAVLRVHRVDFPRRARRREEGLVEKAWTMSKRQYTFF
jgi:hypothetical protein